MNGQAKATLGTGWSASALLDAARTIVEGPLQTVTVYAHAPAIRESTGGGRPVLALIDESAVLSTSLRLPREAIKNARDAAILHLQNETPFSAEALLVSTTAIRDDGDADVTIRIDAVPRTLVVDSLDRSGIALHRVKRIVYAAEGRTATFEFRSTASRALRGGLVALPVLLLALLLLVAGWREQAAWQGKLDEVRGLAVAETTQLRALTSELESRRAARLEFESYDRLLTGGPPARSLLTTLRETLPVGVSVEGLSILDGVAHVRIRSMDVLGTLKVLGQSGQWAASLEGTIAADPSAGDEVATIILRPV